MLVKFFFFTYAVRAELQKKLLLVFFYHHSFVFFKILTYLLNKKHGAILTSLIIDVSEILWYSKDKVAQPSFSTFDEPNSYKEFKLLFSFISVWFVYVKIDF